MFIHNFISYFKFALNPSSYKSKKTQLLMLVLGEAIDYLVQNTFTESAGARKGFPKVAIVITDGKAQDDVEIPARELRDIGVEVFSLGMLSFPND